MDTYDWNELQNVTGGENPVNEPVNEPANEQESAPAQEAANAQQPAWEQQPVYTQQPEANSGAYRWYAERPQAAAPISEPTPEKKQKREKKNGFGKGVVALSLVCALLGGVVGAGGFRILEKAQSEKTVKPTPSSSSATMLISSGEHATVETANVEAGSLMTAAQVYEKNVNSTVGITTEINGYNFFGQPTTSAAAGSGFILTADGYILTNQHVIDGANSITVTMYDGSKYDATLVGEDASNDIAVLKIEAQNLTPVVLGSSDSLKVGEDVVAIGNPLGELTFSLTKGTVSALDRAITLSSGVTMNLIQTDTAINSGNSGGAMFNLYGEVVGITNAKYSSNSFSGEASIDNIGFAIPIDEVRDIVTSIIEKGYISKPYIGVSVGDVSAESQGYGLPKGAAVQSVEADSPAETAGLKPNDIITHVDGEAISGYKDLSNAISERGVDAKMELTVYRQGETLTLTVTIGERIQNARNEQSDSSSGQNQGNPFGGMTPFG